MELGATPLEGGGLKCDLNAGQIFDGEGGRPVRRGLELRPTLPVRREPHPQRVVVRQQLHHHTLNRRRLGQRVDREQERLIELMRIGQPPFQERNAEWVSGARDR